MPKNKPCDDHRQCRCPRLGHVVNFDYCRNGGDDRSPCFKVFDCWWEQFDVVAYFKKHLSEEEFKKLQSASAPGKVATLVDLIRQAKERTGNKT